MLLVKGFERVNMLFCLSRYFSRKIAKIFNFLKLICHHFLKRAQWYPISHPCLNQTPPNESFFQVFFPSGFSFFPMTILFFLPWKAKYIMKMRRTHFEQAHLLRHNERTRNILNKSMRNSWCIIHDYTSKDIHHVSQFEYKFVYFCDKFAVSIVITNVVFSWEPVTIRWLQLLFFSAKTLARSPIISLSHRWLQHNLFVKRLFRNLLHSLRCYIHTLFCRMRNHRMNVNFPSAEIKVNLHLKNTIHSSECERKNVLD